MPACFAVDAFEATNSINQAELDLNLAFVAVAEADAAGADISEMLDNLDNAVDSLSEAKFAYRSDNYAVSSLLAMEVSNAVEEIAFDADYLRVEAEKTESALFVWTGLGSGIGLFLLLVLGFVGWSVLKKRYSEQVLEMKPKVEEPL